MLFKLNRSVPANTTINTPDFQKLKIGKGVITQWLLQMPTECADLMKLRVEYHNTQILPFSGNTWIYGIFEPTVIQENIKISDSPYNLDVFAINSDDTYEHEYNLYVNVMPDKPVTTGGLSSSVIERFKSLFGGGE